MCLQIGGRELRRPSLRRLVPDASDQTPLRTLFTALSKRAGQALCTATVLFFSDYNPRVLEPWTAWLFVSAALMVLYEIYWIRYFRSKRMVGNFYRD